MILAIRADELTPAHLGRRLRATTHGGAVIEDVLMGIYAGHSEEPQRRRVFVSFKCVVPTVLGGAVLDLTQDRTTFSLLPGQPVELMDVAA